MNLYSIFICKHKRKQIVNVAMYTRHRKMRRIVFNVTSRRLVDGNQVITTIHNLFCSQAGNDVVRVEGDKVMSILTKCDAILRYACDDKLLFAQFSSASHITLNLFFFIRVNSAQVAVQVEK